MGIVLGLSEGSGVEIALGAMALFIGAIGLYVKLKTKADKADIMGAVREEIEPIKQDIIDIQQKSAVMSNVLETLVKTIDNNHTEIKDILRERDRSYKENFMLLFEKLDSKQDKK